MKQNDFLPIVKDMNNKLLRDRIIYVRGDITYESSTLAVAQLLYLDAKDDAPINIYINSLGGSVNGAFSIIDTMQLINCPCYTLGIGEVASSAALILVAGKRKFRALLPNTKLLIHQPIGSVSGQQSDIKIGATQIKKVRAKIVKLISESSRLTIDEVDRAIERDCYISPNKAVELGLVDKVYRCQ